uniref:Uncharacterized protein n=1 Tax=Ditylenchus dipsaci TaxID=166011 RepID=A0A915D6A5_9BILA
MIKYALFFIIFSANFCISFSSEFISDSLIDKAVEHCCSAETAECCSESLKADSRIVWSGRLERIACLENISISLL